MEGNHLYEYAIIRLVPRVEREEFINVGVIICSPKANFLRCKIHLKEDKLKVIDPEADMETIRTHLEAITKICVGGKEGGPIGSQNPASRFRWLTAVRSAIIQTSRPHPGLTENLDQTFQQLFEQYVG